MVKPNNVSNTFRQVGSRRLRQGTEKRPLAERGDDMYETPIEATRALVREQALPPRIYDPCAGRGAISRELRGAGYDVVASDLVRYDGADPDIEPCCDFLLVPRAPAGVGAIVMNPTFKLFDEFVRHALTLVPF